MKLFFMSLLIAFTASANEIVIRSRIANDYALFDSIKEIRLTGTSVNPDVLGSWASMEVTGDLKIRDCQHDSAALFLQPLNTPDHFNVTVTPISSNDRVELTSKCVGKPMTVRPFRASLDVVVRDWTFGNSRTWVYHFYGTGGVKLKSVEISFVLDQGWKFREI